MTLKQPTKETNRCKDKQSKCLFDFILPRSLFSFLLFVPWNVVMWKLKLKSEEGKKKKKILQTTHQPFVSIIHIQTHTH